MSDMKKGMADQQNEIDLSPPERCEIHEIGSDFNCIKCGWTSTELQLQKKVVAQQAEIERLLLERGRLLRERDWARHAAGCLFSELQDGMSRWKASDFLSRHPWLDEAARRAGGWHAT